MKINRHIFIEFTLDFTETERIKYEVTRIYALEILLTPDLSEGREKSNSIVMNGCIVDLFKS
jgi:hypothetical protein